MAQVWNLPAGVWTLKATDGKANPADLCMSLAKGARLRGVRIVEEAEVVAVKTARTGAGTVVADGKDHERIRIATVAPSTAAEILTKILARDGFYKGAPSGNFGPDVRAALAAWVDAKGGTSP